MSFFKAYDMRGTFGVDFDLETVRKVGTALVRVVAEKCPDATGRPLRVLVGRDCRVTSKDVRDALVAPDGTERTVEGKCFGAIADAPSGAAGFGYDPLFVPDGFTRSFAELSADEKNAISHRGRALAAAKAML